MSRRKVLYIGTPIFNYYNKIIAEFEEQGYSVDFYNDRPSENSFVKGIIKLNKSLVINLIQMYFDKIMVETKGKSYDLVFIVNCKVFTPSMIQQLKNTQKSAKFVLYMWDSLIHYPNSKALIPLFDKAYSFDSDDCEQIEDLSFLPLFYSRNYEKLAGESIKKSEYDIVSICTAHPNRYKIIRELFPKLESKDVSIFSYMFLNRLQYLYNIAFVPEFKGAKSSEFRFCPLSEEEVLTYIKNSTTVFDIHPAKQNGLTMRTIEALGAKRKVITTNANIKKYDFYNNNNIFILKDDNIDEVKEFIKSKYEPIDEDIYKKYSVKAWVEIITKELGYKYFTC